MRHFSPSTTRKLAAIASLLSIFANSACTGEVYRWQDQQGKIHYGDSPAQDAQRLPLADSPSQNSPQQAEWHQVVSVHDGDTITLDNGEKIRLLGINTPEVGGYKAEEPGGVEARDWLRGKILRQRVRLELDATSRDKYHRLLAHVFDKNGVHLNFELVKAGLATTDIYPPSLKYVDALVHAEQQAEQEKRGIWGLPDHQAKPAESFRTGSGEGWQRFVGIPIVVIQGSSWAGLRFNSGLEAHIPLSDLALFPPLESYLGHRIEVRGWFSHHGSGNSISIRHPSAMPLL